MFLALAAEVGEELLDFLVAVVLVEGAVVVVEVAVEELAVEEAVPVQEVEAAEVALAVVEEPVDNLDLV